MRKRATLLFLSFFTIVFGFAQTAFVVDDIRYQIISDSEKTVAVTWYVDDNGSLYGGSIDIPCSINYNSTEYVVNSITDSAFYKSKIQSIAIPAGINNIGSCAFFECELLESIIIPEGVSTIGDKTFSGCQSLSYLLLPASVKTFGKNVFGGCRELKSAGPKGGGYNYEFSWSDTIPGSAFNSMSGLKSVYIPRSVKLINDQGIAFREYVEYGANAIVHYFTPMYFEGCTSLESLAISFSDTKIMKKRSAYVNYKWESPADYDLYLGTPIHSITVLDDTIKILNDQGLEFRNIDEIVISEYVKDIHPSFFRRATYIENIDVEKGSAIYSATGGVLLNKSGNELLAYPPARDDTDYTTPNGVTEIAGHAFNKNKNLCHVTISEDVEIVGDSAFESCLFLETVNFLGSSQINHNAFIDCPNIEIVRSCSATPGMMQLLDVPKAIMVGPDLSNRQGMRIEESYNGGLGRNIYKIYNEGNKNWSFDIISTDITAGRYKVNIGILPNEAAQMPNYIHPIIKGVTDSTDVVLYEPIDSVETSDIYGSKDMIATARYIANDITGYDLILIADTLTIPEGFKGIKITLSSGVNEMNSYIYTSQLWLDRIFFAPLDKDVPAEKYTGPFDELVFKNATLFVPDGLVDVYSSADGWKLFKNIRVDTAVNPVYHNSGDKSATYTYIYDLYGRIIKADCIEMLPSGLYIINGKKMYVK